MKDSPLYPVLYMVVLAAVFGAAVSAVAVATRSRVEAGERARFRSHVLYALGVEAPEDPEALAGVWTRTVEARRDGDGPYFVARAADGSVRGYAFLFRGQGFWGPIEGVLAVDPAGERVLGLSFTAHQETPGLGGRIAEDWFREQFRGKPVRAPGPGAPVLRFVFRKPAGEREVEAITGATQTSRRLARFLNDFLTRLPGRAPLARGGAG
ncbi:MAG: hypothetical protein Kow0092_24620 [Deferrisomatales bacterium]